MSAPEKLDRGHENSARVEKISNEPEQPHVVINREDHLSRILMISIGIFRSNTTKLFFPHDTFSSNMKNVRKHVSI